MLEALNSPLGYSRLFFKSHIFFALTFGFGVMARVFMSAHDPRRWQKSLGKSGSANVTTILLYGPGGKQCLGVIQDLT